MLSAQQQFSKPLTDLKDVIDSARCYYETWSALKHDIPPLQQEKIPLEAQIFFTHSRFTHYKCMVIDLYMILDTNRKAVSLRNVFPEALRLGIIDAAEHSEGLKRIAAIEPIWEKVRELRHRLFAHTERAAFYDDIMAPLNLLAEDFEKLIDGALYALDVIWSKYFSPGRAVLNFERNYYRDQTKKFTNSILSPFYKSA
jgi:hypothetical protein